MVENILKISCIFMAAKNHTSYFANTPFGHKNTSGPRTHEETPSPIKTFCWNILESVDFNFKLSWHIWSYLGYIVNSDNVFGHFPTENLKVTSKMSLLFIQAVKGVEDEVREVKVEVSRGQWSVIWRSSYLLT